MKNYTNQNWLWWPSGQSDSTDNTPTSAVTLSWSKAGNMAGAKSDH